MTMESDEKKHTVAEMQNLTWGFGFGIITGAFAIQEIPQWIVLLGAFSLIAAVIVSKVVVWRWTNAL